MHNTPTQTITLFGRTIPIGPGTVPRSPGSPEKTDMKKVAEHLRRFSELGGYDDEEGEHSRGGSR